MALGGEDTATSLIKLVCVAMLKGKSIYMKKNFKNILKWMFVPACVVTCILAFGIGAFFWIGRDNAGIVASMCNIESGTSIEEVMEIAMQLGFSKDSQVAFRSGFVVYSNQLCA